MIDELIICLLLQGPSEHTLDGTIGSCISSCNLCWTNDDYADGGSFDDEDTIYDTRTQEGSHVEQGPVLNCVVCWTLFRF
jgi:hypothetical protein